MTDSNLRELDVFIQTEFLKLPTKMYHGEYYEDSLNFDELVPLRYYSSDPTAFALVKREVERRGWEWACAYERPTEHLKSACIFTVYVIREPETNAPICYDKLASSEELAGCLAVKAAVEGSNANPD